MNELVKSLRHFVVRDIVFMIGGGIVISSFFYVFPELRPKHDDHVVVFLFIAGLSYVIGYGIQDGANWLGLTKVAPAHKLSCALTKHAYKRITGEEWADIIKEVNFREAERCIDADNAEGVRLERIIGLKQVGTTVGPCCFVASIAIVVGHWDSFGGEGQDIALVISGIVFGVLLIMLSRAKAAEQGKMLEEAFRRKQGERNKEV